MIDKTVCKWFKELPKDIRKKAIRNTIKQGPEFLVHNVKSLVGAMWHAFTWELTPEGHIYWSEIHSELVHREKSTYQHDLEAL